MGWNPGKVQAWWQLALQPIFNWVGAWALIQHEATKTVPQFYLVLGAFALLGVSFVPPSGKPGGGGGTGSPTAL